MPKVGRDIRERWKERFYNARTADELCALLEQIRSENRYPFDDFLRDAWIAANFANSRGLHKVRLAQNPPDFLLVDEAGTERPFEATEALDPCRRRDAEYRLTIEREDANLSTAEHDPPENWLTPEQADAWLRCASSNKATKNYPVGTSLVIYLNGGNYGLRTSSIVATMTDATAAAGKKFKEVWVLWSGKSYLTWRDQFPAHA